MRNKKYQAKNIQTRPEWLKNDRDWDIFVDYRDSKQSAESLATLYNLSRAQVQNIITKIVKREGRPGSLSNRATNVLNLLGLTLEPQKLRGELEELKVRAVRSAGSLEQFLRRDCGPKTTAEILKLYEDLDSDTHLNAA